MPDWLLLLLGILLTVGTGVFVASEFSMVNLDRVDLEARRDRGEQGLGLTITALRHTSTHLSAAQLGITLTTLLAGWTLEPGVSHLLSPVFQAAGVNTGVSVGIASVLSILVATALSMIFGELVPKNFALAEPRRAARLIMPIQTSFTWFLHPVVVVLNGCANGFLRMIGVTPQEELSSARSPEELASLLRRSVSEGTLEHTTASLLGRTLRFSSLDASQVMTPRAQIVALSRNDSCSKVIEAARQSGFSRFPVYDADLDDVVGIVHLKLAVAVPRDRRAEVPVAAVAAEAFRVPETVNLDTLLRELRARGFQMAVVLDEYGGTAGLVTLEDLVEELVGEVRDEHDRETTGAVRRGGNVTFPGLWRIDELRDRAGISLPSDPKYETVAGFLVAELGRMPKLGDRVQTEAGTLSVRHMDGRRIERVSFEPSSSGDFDSHPTPPGESGT